MNFLIQLVVGLVLTVAGNLLQQAFAPNRDERRRTGTRGVAQVGGKVPQYFLIGTVADAGKREYRNVWGTSGDVPNAYSVDVISFGDLPVSGMTGLYVNGVAVTLDTENEDATLGIPVTEYRDGGADHLWIKFYDGTQTSADAYLVNKFGSDPDRPWGADMIGVGVPYMIATTLWNEKLFSGFPTYVAQIEGIPLYDPRSEATAFSDNNMVIVRAIERGISYDGSHIWGGTAAETQLPPDLWDAAMDACDESVSLDAGGSEKRFRGGRKVQLSERPADVIRDFLIGGNARICHASDGTIYPLVGVPDAVDGSFSDTDILATNRFGTIPHPNLDEVINGATATYREPVQAWEDKETAPYFRADLEASDDGRRQTEGLSLETVFSGTQAQRVLQATVEEGRRFRRHVVALPPEFAVYRPLQILAWTSSRFDYDAKRFLITIRTREPWGNVILGLQEVDPSDHAWVPSTDERPLTFAPVVTNRPVPQIVAGVTVSPAIDQAADGSNRRGGYDVTWPTTAVAVDVEFVRIAHRLQGETTVRWVGLVPRPDLLTGSARVTEALIGGEAFEVQVLYIAPSGREIVASDWQAVTIPQVGDIGFSALRDEVNKARLWAARQIEQMIADYDATIAQLADGLLGEAYERQTMRQAISAQFGQTRASYTLAVDAVASDLGAAVTRVETLEAAVEDSETGLDATATALDALSTSVSADLEAVASTVTAVEASVGNVLAGGRIKIESVAAPDGWAVRAAFSVQGEDDGEYVHAGVYLDAKSDGTSRILLDAAKTVITGEGGALEFDGTTGTLSIGAP